MQFRVTSLILKVNDMKDEDKTTIEITGTTWKALNRIKAEVMQKDGKPCTHDRAIRYLIKKLRENKGDLK